ncbi:monovalent cation/H+ antiporter subunit D family protein [Amphiplicatus metriothermophilus]|uniref:Multisubunit sodium/proton antiporter, MrpD subunit n=1 Tax=Amphiplicatus metriothermophilus TaxID=1519374 RepID=A0A239PYY9_9PROT|nr:monovalent cation/H+ antiporter subunit D family protein [Amphiplicatus metriothermophilus]MBB5518254.1 multicomponent Na+:H+ antiporter subunit D [Amphiplicatus metriothermophilus]SNT75474.1 multisubunit sodium/proton antiporter, MrpD subunit [Amphiplicatus metriothermophilus]
MNLMAQLPVLPVVIPFVAGALALLLPKGRAPWAWATFVSWLSFLASALLLREVAATGPVSYHLGDWPPPWGIEYRIDLANAIVLALVSGIAAAVAPFAYESVRAEIDERQSPYFYAAFLICVSGLLGVTATGDAFNIFVFLEISSLSTYALVAMGGRQDRRALTAAFTYLVMGTLGATFFVIGVGLLYHATGTLNLADLHLKLAGQHNRVVEAGFAFILVGIGLKLAMFPMHLWLPNAYAYAPSAVSAFLAATATKVAVYVLVRFFYSVFGLDFAFLGDALTYVLLPLGVAGMFVASLIAVFQHDVKRMLAYSSVGQIGYMLLGLSFGTREGLAAALIHLVNHGLMKGALFLAVACVVYRLGDHRCAAFSGLARRMPVTTWAFVLSGLSLIGVPGTVGFVSKWYLLEASFAAGHAWAAFMIVASSLIAVLYVGRVVELMLLREPPEQGPLSEPVKEAPLSMLIPMWALVAANLYFGLRTEFTAGFAEQAAAALMTVSGGR